MYLLVALITTASVTALSDSKPPMGWRSWNLYGDDVNQELLESQILGLTRRKNSIDGKPTSLHDLGYSSIGLDDGWQACGQGVNGSYHDENGNPLVDKKKFPSLIEMTARGHAVNVTMGWYGNNCGCNEVGKVGPYYAQDARATVAFGFDAIKIDSCGPSGNIPAWRSELDKASADAGASNPIEIENCRNYRYVDNLTQTTPCEAQLFRSTEDNAPDFLSIMANLVMNTRAPTSRGAGPYGPTGPWGGLPISHPGCWSYPDMLEIGPEKCKQDLPAGTCGSHSSARREGGLNANQSRTHFAAWCIVSSPLILGHDLSSAESYDAAWPIVSNVDAIAIDQESAGNDFGRLVAVSNHSFKTDVYHGSGCECVWLGSSLPTWMVFAKRLNAAATRAAVLAINVGESSLPAGSISVPMSAIFGVDESADRFKSVDSILEYDVWRQDESERGPLTAVSDEDAPRWSAPELSPQSSYFVTLQTL